MKAKIKPRINLDNRTKLQEVIPLDTPLTLFIDPSSICNFKCKFCPTGHPELIKLTKRPQIVMDFNLYKKIIDDLKEFDAPLKILRLYKEGEPLINKHFADMVQYAKNNNINYIDTTTNGYLLTPEKIKSILDAGLDRINISVMGMSEKELFEFANVRIDFDKYVNNIINLYKLKEEHGYKCEICIKTTGDFLSDYEKKQFFNTFGDYADRIFIENIAPCWSNFNVENHLNINIHKGIYDNLLTDVQTCPYIFYSTTINSDGSVSLCFLDWEHKLIIGDVKKQSLKEIWNGDVLFSYQVQNLMGKRKEISSCVNCGQLTHCLPDDIDTYVDIITKKLLNKRKVR